MSEPSSTLDLFLDPLAACLTPEVALRIANLETDERTRSRLEELRKRANEGQLSSSERSEYQELVEGHELLAIFKAKACSVLESADSD